jgi:hypothetical protein
LIFKIFSGMKTRLAVGISTLNSCYLEEWLIDRLGMSGRQGGACLPLYKINPQ